jgi:hypothetical protein
MAAAANWTGPSDRPSSIEDMLAEIPNGPGDVWSILIAVVGFALLFALLRLLERV